MAKWLLPECRRLAVPAIVDGVKILDNHELRVSCEAMSVIVRNLQERLCAELRASGSLYPMLIDDLEAMSMTG